MKTLKYIILTLAAGLFLYHSVYFESLSERQQREQQSEFNAAVYVQQFWQELQHELGNAVNVSELLRLFRTDMPTAVKKYGKTLGVSKEHSYLVQGKGKITNIADDQLLLSLIPSSETVAITTDYIFGNEIRDASGLVRVSDFPSTMEFNRISSEINKRVTTQVLPAILDSVAVGDTLDVVGATTVHETSPQLDPLTIVPIKLTLLSKSH